MVRHETDTITWRTKVPRSKSTCLVSPLVAISQGSTFRKTHPGDRASGVCIMLYFKTNIGSSGCDKHLDFGKCYQGGMVFLLAPSTDILYSNTE